MTYKTLFEPLPIVIVKARLPTLLRADAVVSSAIAIALL